MLKNIIVLPDGTEVSSGSNHVNAIQSVTLTQSVNNSEELTLGSACAAMLEAKLITPGGGLDIPAGTEVTLYKQDDAGTRHKMGLFTLEKPTRPTAGTMKLVGYDRVTKLDKDLTAWLAGLGGWPYCLIDFAGMVCEACGLALADGNIPNADFPVQAFSLSAVTGRQLMSWIGEIACRFVRANADGDIELAWYEPSDAAYTSGGENYFFAGSLSYETYRVAKIDMVQMRLANSDSGALYPEAEESANSYIITGNAILTAAVTEDLLPYLEVIWEELEGVSYTPCTVSVPATVAVNAGDIIHVTDKNGVEIGVYVMEKVTAGQKTTLKCTGSQRRDSTAAVNNRTAAQVAQNAVNNQTQQQIFDKLTNGGKLQGLYIQDGKLYINAELVQIVNLVAAVLESKLDASALRIDGAALTLTSDGKLTAEVNNTAPGLPILYLNDYVEGALTHRGELSPHHLRLGGKGAFGSLVVDMDMDGTPRLTLGADGVPRRLGWQPNGDGTFTLIGM